MVQFDQSGIDSIDFSHNPKLFSVAMLFTPIKNLNMMNNPRSETFVARWLHQLQTVDVRAQTNFDFYFIDHAKYQGISDADVFGNLQGWDGFTSADFPVFALLLQQQEPE